MQNQQIGRARYIHVVPFKIEQLPRNLKEEVEGFLARHPRTPAARLRPDMMVTRNLWLAFIGPELHEGASGIGRTPSEALEDFNRHFLEPIVSRNGHEPKAPDSLR